jgi:hypothetical protein
VLRLPLTNRSHLILLFCHKWGSKTGFKRGGWPLSLRLVPVSHETGMADSSLNSARPMAQGWATAA